MKGEIKLWYKPNKDFFAIKITEQNPCGCCHNLVIVDKKIEGRKKVSYCFYLGPNQSIENHLYNTDWEKLK